MNYFISIILTIFISNLSFAYDSTIQASLKNEFGTCYKKIQDDLYYCNANTCVYPDSSKAWRAHVVRGMSGANCYVISYSYIGNNIIGDPEDCFYSSTDIKNLSNLYGQLFNTDSIIDAADIKARITQININSCKKRNVISNPK